MKYQVASRYIDGLSRPVFNRGVRSARRIERRPVMPQKSGVAARRTIMLPTGNLIAVAMHGQSVMMIPPRIGGWGLREGAGAWAIGAAELGANTSVAVTTAHAPLSLTSVAPGPACCWPTPGGTARRGLAGRRDPILRHAVRFGRARVGGDPWLTGRPTLEPQLPRRPAWTVRSSWAFLAPRVGPTARLAPPARQLRQPSRVPVRVARRSQGRIRVARCPSSRSESSVWTGCAVSQRCLS